MKRTLWLIAVLAVLLGAFATLSRFSSPGPVAYVGGPILTMDAENRVVDGLATDGDRVVAVGSESEIRAWADAHRARIVALGGRAIVPGFIDAHGHFPGTGIYSIFVDLNSPPIGEVTDMDTIVELLAARAADAAPGEWVVGMGYDDMLVAERRHPTRHDLDRASREHPIAVLHISGHLAAVNSAGLEKIGITADTADPVGGVIRRESPSGEPDGVLEETAMEAMQQALTPGLMDGYEIVRAASQQYVSQGVTTAQSGYTPRKLIGGYTWMSRLGMIPLRLVIWPDADAADGLLDGSFAFTSYDPLRVRLGAVKLIADGSIQGYTGYLSEPYFVAPGDDPSYRGYPRIEREKLFELVDRFHAGGLQLAIHGNGDASIEDILDALEAAQGKTPRDDTRHVVIHAQMTRDDQLDRMAELGVVPSFFSLHTFYWGDRHREIFMGPERAARISPARSAMDRNVRFTIHADAPVVPMEPLRLVWSAVNRKTRSGQVLGAAERLTPMQALRAVTIDAAWQHFEEADKGSLEPGKLADLVILSRSPLDEPETIDAIDVVETVVGGETVYRADGA